MSDVIKGTKFTKNRVLEIINASPEAIKILPNGVDIERFFPIRDTSEIRKKFNITPHAKVLLTLARVVERKGHDTVIQALPQILQKFPNTVYVIAGPWRQWVYDELQQLITQLNLEQRVIFTGHLENDLLKYVYNMADVYIMVSKELKTQGDVEGFGITFLEANACEKPVIGSISGGIPEAVVDGKTGFLVQPGDTGHIAQRVLELFENPSLAHQLGKNGRDRVEQELTWEKIAERLVLLLNGN